MGLFQVLTSQSAMDQADICIAHAAVVTVLQATYATLEREHALRGYEGDVHRCSHLYGLLDDWSKLRMQD